MSADPSFCDPDFRLADAPTEARLPRGTYEQRLQDRQHDLRALQLAMMANRGRAVVVFEGWDAGGKGGTIRRMASVLEPRAVEFWSIGAPKPQWQGRHYLERFWSRLPEAGHFAIFDRSWYGRVLVERVEDIVPPAVWKRAYREINDFERMLLDDGVRIVKIFMHISADEQLNRFQKRLDDPMKRWKITLDDIRNREMRDDYAAAIEDMVRKTSTVRAPWHVIPADNKKFARVEAMRLIHDALSEGTDSTPPDVDPNVARAAHQRLGLKLPEAFKSPEGI